MSQALFLRVESLEERMARLEEVADAHFHAQQPSFEPDPPFQSEYHVVHRGFGNWFVEAPDGTSVNTKGLTKEEAEETAKQMNDSTKGLSAA